MDSVALILAGFGFLVVLVIAWYHGEKGSQRVSGLEAGLLIGIVALGGVTLWLVRGENAAAPGIVVADYGFLGPPEPSDRRIAEPLRPTALLIPRGEPSGIGF